jgi:hypothetical protein
MSAAIRICRGFEGVLLRGKSVPTPEFSSNTRRGINTLQRNIRRLSTVIRVLLRFSSVSTRSPRMLIKAHYSLCEEWQAVFALRTETNSQGDTTIYPISNRSTLAAASS